MVVQSVLLAGLVTWPTVTTFTTHAVGSATTDTPKHLWTLWWMRQEAWAGTPGAWTTWVNWPDGMALYPIAPLDGIAAALLPLGPIALSNLLALLHVTLLGVCAAWLGVEVTGTRIGAHAAGALAQACAFTGFTLEVGVGELRAVWLLPLGLACLVRAHRTLDRRWFLALAGVLGGAVIVCFYHGLFLGVAVAVWALSALVGRAAHRSRRLLAGYALAAGLALLVAVPVVRGFAGTYGGTEKSAQAFAADSWPGASVSVEELWTPGAALTATGRRYTGGRYLGWGALFLAGIGVAAGPRRALPWLAIAGVSVVLSLGPTLTWRGAPVPWGDQVLHLPMRLLNAGLAIVGEPLNFPARFLAPGMVALSVLAAMATRWRWTALLVPFAMADTLLNDRAAWPRQSVALPTMTAFAVEARSGGGAGGGAIGGPGAVANLTLAANSEPAERNLAIAAQIAMNRPFAAIPIERLSDWSRSGNAWLAALPLTPAVTQIGAPPPSADALRADLWLLGDRGFAWILLTHAGPTADARAERVLVGACGAPVRATGGSLWRIPPVTATPGEASAWRTGQGQRVSARAERR